MLSQIIFYTVIAVVIKNVLDLGYYNIPSSNMQSTNCNTLESCLNDKGTKTGTV